MTSKSIDRNIENSSKIKYRSALAFLTGSMIGVGYLTLPVSCKAVGIVLGLLIIIFAGISSFYSEFMLMRAYSQSETDNYPDLVKEILGQKHFFFINFNLLLYVVFSSTMYLYFGNEIFLAVILKYGVTLDDFQTTMIKLGIFSLAFILSFFKLENIRWFGYVGNVFSFYTACVLISQVYSYYNEGRFKQIVYFNPSLGVFVVIGACFFAYSNHFGIIPIMKILKNESKYLNMAALFRSHYFPMFLYSTVAYSGYISFG